MQKYLVVLIVHKITVKPLLTATSLQWPLFFRPGGQKIHTLTLVQNLSTTVTSLQQPQAGPCREVKQARNTAQAC